MRPRLTAFARWFSLLLCAAAVVLWVRSYHVHYRGSFRIADARYTIQGLSVLCSGIIGLDRR